MGTCTETHAKELGSMGRLFSNLERLKYWRLKGRLARNEPRKTDWGFSRQGNKSGLYPLGRGKPLKSNEEDSAKCPTNSFCTDGLPGPGLLSKS